MGNIDTTLKRERLNDIINRAESSKASIEFKLRKDTYKYALLAKEPFRVNEAEREIQEILEKEDQLIDKYRLLRDLIDLYEGL